MFIATIVEHEGSGYPNHEYCSYRGRAVHKRSAKKAMLMAQRALRHSYRAGGSRKDPMWTGVPILSEMKLTYNGRVLLSKCD